MDSAIEGIMMPQEVVPCIGQVLWIGRGAGQGPFTVRAVEGRAIVEMGLELH